MIGININQIMTDLQSICFYYEKSAPAVSQWADDLYIRIQEDLKNVTLEELCIMNHFMIDDTFIHPNMAQNTLYHLLGRIDIKRTMGMIDY